MLDCSQLPPKSGFCRVCLLRNMQSYRSGHLFSPLCASKPTSVANVNCIYDFAAQSQRPKRAGFHASFVGERIMYRLSRL